MRVRIDPRTQRRRMRDDDGTPHATQARDGPRSRAVQLEDGPAAAPAAQDHRDRARHDDAGDPRASRAAASGQHPMSKPRIAAAYDPAVLFAPEVLLDIQIMPKPLLPCRGEYALCAAILERALEDARPHAREDLNHRRSAKREAREWLMDDDRTWPFSY